MQIERTQPTVVTVHLAPDGPGWEAWFLLRSDVHLDNAYCNQDLVRAHLEEARRREAGVLDFGDHFCAMQGRWDKRADPEQLRPELRGADYLDALVRYHAAFCEPYADRFLFLSPGNHETAIMEHHHSNLIERLAERLRVAGGRPMVGSYQGWVRFQFAWQKTKRATRTLRYTHGYGGGGPVTKDLIQLNRQLAYTEGADIIVSGHTHDAWEVTQRRETLDLNGKPFYRDVAAIKLGGYKDEFAAGGGWAVRRGHPPKPLGAYWLRFYLLNSRVFFDVHRAK